jgi:hypothetical protein
LEITFKGPQCLLVSVAMLVAMLMAVSGLSADDVPEAVPVAVLMTVAVRGGPTHYSVFRNRLA